MYERVWYEQSLVRNDQSVKGWACDLNIAYRETDDDDPY